MELKNKYVQRYIHVYKSNKRNEQILLCTSQAKIDGYVRCYFSKVTVLTMPLVPTPTHTHQKDSLSSLTREDVGCLPL